jgi:HPt (histidine-containing phosphotransfer) domain-containing protein
LPIYIALLINIMANTPPNFNLTDPIDLETGIKSIGDEETFYNIMEGFDEMTLIETLNKMKESIQSQDFPKLRDAAHSLKGASGYLAAGRIFKLCESIHKCIDTKNYDGAIQLYPTFIAESITLRLYIKKLICKRKSTCINRLAVRRRSTRF